MKKVWLLMVSVTLVLMLAACGGKDEAGPVAGVDYEVEEEMPEGAEDARVIKLDFTPQTIIPNEVTIKAGEKILFEITNTDEDGEHNFLNADANLEEILVYGGQTVRRLWTAPETPGTYEPLCTLHPWIKMTFIVE